MKAPCTCHALLVTCIALMPASQQARVCAKLPACDALLAQAQMRLLSAARLARSPADGGRTLRARPYPTSLTVLLSCLPVILLCSSDLDCAGLFISVDLFTMRLCRSASPSCCVTTAGKRSRQAGQLSQTPRHCVLEALRCCCCCWQSLARPQSLGHRHAAARCQRRALGWLRWHQSLARPRPRARPGLLAQFLTLCRHCHCCRCRHAQILAGLPEQVLGRAPQARRA